MEVSITLLIFSSMGSVILWPLFKRKLWRMWFKTYKSMFRVTTFCPSEAIIILPLSICQWTVWVILWYQGKFTLIFSKEACWRSLSLRDSNAGYVILMELKEKNKRRRKYRISYSLKSRLIFFKETRAGKASEMFSIAGSFMRVHLMRSENDRRILLRRKFKIEIF